jgi:hypothetical protein
VQHRDRADLGAEITRVGGNLARCLGRRVEQDGIDHRLVEQRNLGDGCGQREHDMEIGDRQQLGLARIEPVDARQGLALRAMPVATRVVRATNQSAVDAVLDMPTQHRRSARLDRHHHAAFCPAEMACRYAGP